MINVKKTRLSHKYCPHCKKDCNIKRTRITRGCILTLIRSLGTFPPLLMEQQLKVISRVCQVLLAVRKKTTVVLKIISANLCLRKQKNMQRIMTLNQLVSRVLLYF